MQYWIRVTAIQELGTTLGQMDDKQLKFLRKYKIVTGINTTHRINPEYDKYFAKYVNDDVVSLGNTETQAIENLKNLYIEHKRRDRLCSPSSKKVLHSYISTERFEKYMGIATDFFNFIGEDPDSQIDDEFTVNDFGIENHVLEKLILEYRIDIKQEDLLVDIFEKIGKSCA